MASSPNSLRSNYAHDVPVGENHVVLWSVMGSKTVVGPPSGVQSVIDALQKLSSYDFETSIDLAQLGTSVEDEVPEMDTANQDMVASNLAKGKFNVALCNQRHYALSAIKAHQSTFDNLTVLQLDAHLGMRSSTTEQGIGHDNCMAQLSEEINLVQVGIRTMHISEKNAVKRQNVFFVHDIRKNPDWINEMLETMTRDVYITIDPDVFELSLTPDVAQPVPGGLRWDETMRLLRRVVKKRNVVGFDISGLSQMGSSSASPVAMAHLYLKLLSYIFNKRKKSI